MKHFEVFAKASRSYDSIARWAGDICSWNIYAAVWYLWCFMGFIDAWMYVCAQQVGDM